MRAHLSLLLLLGSGQLFAQLKTGFESAENYVGSSAGVSVNGQNGWYQPVPDSTDGLIVTSLNNAFGFVKPPDGDGQYLVCAANESFPFIVSRAQHDLTFTATTWTLTYDWNAKWLGQGAATDFLGSVSLQPSLTANMFQTVLKWDDVNNPTTYSALYGVTDAAGLPSGQQPTQFLSPGKAWENLKLNHWYRSSTTWNFVTNRIERMSIRNLTTGSPGVSAHQTEWYLTGGVYNKQQRPLPTAIRFFAGGSSTGNAVAYDNVYVRPLADDEILAPVKELVVLGTWTSGGDLDSWADDDNNARNVCLLFVPNWTGPFIRIDLDFQSAPQSLSELKFLTKIKDHTAGTLKLDLAVRDMVTGFFVQTNVSQAPVVNGATYEAIPPGDLSRYVGSNGKITGRIEIFRRGPSVQLYPCCSFEFSQMRLKR